MENAEIQPLICMDVYRIEPLIISPPSKGVALHSIGEPIPVLLTGFASALTEAVVIVFQHSWRDLRPYLRQLHKQRGDAPAAETAAHSEAPRGRKSKGSKASEPGSKKRRSSE